MIKFLGDLLEKRKLKKQIARSMEDYREKTKRYETFSKAEFETLPDDELWSAAISWIYKQTQTVEPEQHLKVLSKMPISCQNVIAVNAVDGEVNNGGFNQYYFNKSNVLSVKAYDALRAIEAFGLAEIVEKADNLYNTIKDDLEKFNDGSLESFSKSYEDNPLNEFDDKYYEVSKSEDVLKLLNQYIRLNINDFGN